jgi:c-di-GMP-related signal transduction protein
VIDALMDAPIEDVVAMIPFPSDMRDALTERKGEKGALLECVAALEAGDFDRAQKLVRGAGDRYVEALMWANDAARPLFEPVVAAAA